MSFITLKVRYKRKVNCAAINKTIATVKSSECLLLSGMKNASNEARYRIYERSNFVTSGPQGPSRLDLHNERESRQCIKMVMLIIVSGDEIDESDVKLDVLCNFCIIMLV